MSDDADYGRWWMWDGDAWMVRSLGDGRKVLPTSTRLPASFPNDSHLRVLCTDNKRFVDIQLNIADSHRGRSSAHLLLDRQRAEVLRDWLTAFIRRTTPE